MIALHLRLCHDCTFYGYQSEPQSCDGQVTARSCYFENLNSIAISIDGPAVIDFNRVYFHSITYNDGGCAISAQNVIKSKLRHAIFSSCSSQSLNSAFSIALTCSSNQNVVFNSAWVFNTVSTHRTMTLRCGEIKMRYVNSSQNTASEKSAAIWFGTDFPQTVTVKCIICRGNNGASWLLDMSKHNKEDDDTTLPENSVAYGAVLDNTASNGELLYLSAPTTMTGCIFRGNSNVRVSFHPMSPSITFCACVFSEQPPSGASIELVSPEVQDSPDSFLASCPVFYEMSKHHVVRMTPHFVKSSVAVFTLALT